MQGETPSARACVPLVTILVVLSLPLGAGKTAPAASGSLSELDFASANSGRRPSWGP